MDLSDQSRGAGILARLLNWCYSRPCFVFALFIFFYFGFVMGSARQRIALESHLVTGDGFYHFCWAHSLYFDGDVNFKNQYEDFGPVCMGRTYLPLSGDQAAGPPSLGNGRLLPEAASESKVPAPFGPWEGPFDEYPGNTAAIGSAILWMPFLALAHALTLALRALGLASLPADGYSLVYQVAAAAGTNFYAFLGFCIVYKALRLDFGAGESFFAVLFFVTASALVNYLVYQTAYGHTQEFFVVGAILYLLLRYRSFAEMTYLNALAVGALVGLAALVRWPASAWALLPVVTWLRDVAFRPARIRTAAKGLLFALATVAVFSPQAIAWKAIYGSYLANPGGVHWAGEFPILRLKEMLLLLFSNNHGLFFWHPVTLAGFAGIFVGFSRHLRVERAHKIVIALSVAVFVVLVYFGSLVFDWWCGSAFGMRRMIGTYPVLAWGLAALLARWGLVDRRPFAVTAAWLVLSAWNAILLFIWIFHLGGGLFPH